MLKEVATLLDTGAVVGAKQHKEYLEVLGYSRAATWVYEHAHKHRDPSTNELITVQEVREAHYLAMKDVWAIYPHPNAVPGEEPARFRLHDIYRFDGGMTPPNHVLVASEMDLWVRAVRAFGDSALRGAVFADQVPLALAELHRRFEGIHPFIDGNG